MDLNSLNIFVHVVQQGSFSGASRAMNIPVATISRRVSELEAQLQQSLLVRTTRKLTLTPSGKVLYQRACVGLDEIFAAKQAMNEQQEEYKGKLRISIPPALYVLDDMFHAFNEAYPDIQLEVFSSVKKVDFIEDDIDILIRIGKLNYESAIARHLGQFRHVIVSSQKFINRYGMPKHPSELATLPIAAWISRDSEVIWQLGEHCQSIKPKFLSNDYAHILSSIRTGNMLGELPPMLANSLIDSGELVEVLTDFPLPLVDLHLLYPSRKHLSRLSKAFIDDFIAFCQQHSHDGTLFNRS
ncbi:transcriptional regulator, LysR family [Shewanella psychrophila]|uniref:Transcriptional regulator, LysR family n=1 Tax=Shewanella psychrophila TaxID=225848 RepID=A0A1S6HVS1_9GAMM|nr:LysR family transcriptional regulator [Shewanella psychrophila]AQS39676.1 transcriptional regulator, LysR family [Shewanella psychrophila]